MQIKLSSRKGVTMVEVSNGKVVMVLPRNKMGTSLVQLSCGQGGVFLQYRADDFEAMDPPLELGQLVKVAGALDLGRTVRQGGLWIDCTQAPPPVDEHTAEGSQATER